MHIRKRFFAWLLKKGDSFNEILYGGIKTQLFLPAKGKILEVGPGTGVNFKHLKNVDQWFGIEPNTFFHQALLNEALHHKIKASLITSDAESIALEDNSMDVVICTLVLCSVAHPEKAIHEMKRVLKPGGRLIFIEHVVAPDKSSLRKVQNLLNPLNRFIADGCNCNRETWTYLEKAGFEKLELRHFKVDGAIKLHAPHIMGVGIK